MGRLSVFGIAMIAIILLALLGAAPAQPDNPQCSAPGFDTYTGITYVIDGDTVILEDGRKLRLIGIDTPELGRDGKPGQKGATAARDRLQELLKPRNKYPIVYDAERHDHYGRLLAHLFLPDGTNIQALLLAEGLATPFTVPPNLRLLDCYQRMTNQAMAAERGLWRHNQYRPTAVTALTDRKRRYRVIEGYVTRVGASRSSVWINLGDHLAIRVTRSDLKYFDGLDLDNLVGNYVRARGMLYDRNGEMRLRLRHQVDIQLLPPPGESDISLHQLD